MCTGLIGLPSVSWGRMWGYLSQPAGVAGMRAGVEIGVGQGGWILGVLHLCGNVLHIFFSKKSYKCQVLMME